MSKKEIYFVIVPRLDNSSPIKGAIALCNYLVKIKNVVLIDLYGENKNNLNISSKLKRITLKNKKIFYLKIIEIQKIYRSFKSLRKISISFCFSADILNFFCKNLAYTIASLRGNISLAYRYDHGFFRGYLMSKVHYLILDKLDLVLTMNLEQEKIIESKTNTPYYTVGNFLDETVIQRSERNKTNNKYTITFLGRLVPLKKIDILIDAFKNLTRKYENLELIIAGEGQSEMSLRKQAKSLNILDKVIFCGHINDPFSILEKTDLVVIPSLTEGTSRTALEALYLGIPCIMRNTSGNNELITSNSMGLLFDDDNDLYLKMIDIYKKKARYNNQRNKSLLQESNTQNYCVNQLINKINNVGK